MPVTQAYHHAAGTMHGSVYFRLLDDACYFAALSLEPNFFLHTKSFTIDLKRPHVEGIVIAEGCMDTQTDKSFFCFGTLINESGNILAKGRGEYVRSQLRLEQFTS